MKAICINFRLITALIVVFFIIPAANLACEVTIHVDSSFLEQEVLNVELHPGSHKVLTDDIRRDTTWTDFGRHRYRTLFNGQYRWLRFHINNHYHSDQKLILEFANASVPSILVRVFGESDKHEFAQTGTDFAFDTRSENYRMPHFPVLIPANSEVEVYVRIKGNGTNQIIPIGVWSETHIQNTRRTRLTFLTAFFAVMFTIIIYGFLIFILIKSEFRWYYILFIIAGTFTVATHLGFCFQFFWPDLPKLQQGMEPFLSNISFLLGVLLLKSFFRTAQNYPIINRAFDFLIIAFGLMSLIGLLIPFAGAQTVSVFFVINHILYIIGAIWVIISPFAFFVRNQDLEGFAFFFIVGIFLLNLIISSLEAIDVFRLGQHVPTWTWVGMLTLNLTLTIFVLRRVRKTIDDGFKIEGEVSRRKRMNMMVLLRREATVRSEIGNEIEERVGPLIDSVESKLQAISSNPEIAGLMDQVVDARSEIRGISENRIPGNLADMHLIPALDEIILPLEEAGIRIKRDYPSGRRLRNLDILYKQATFRIAQGLLNNIYKHAEAKNVLISITLEDNQLHLHIKDDGKGFIPDPERGGKGLKIIRRRVESLGGSFQASSEKGGGTDSHVSFKLKF